LVLAVLGASGALAACGGNDESLGPADAVAIEIGPQKITNGEIDRRALFIATRPDQNGQAPPAPDKASDDFQTTRRTAAEQLRDERAFAILAEQCGKPCLVTKKEVEDQVQQLIDAPRNLGGFNKDRKAFDKALADGGITLTDLKASFTANLREQRLTSRESDKVTVTDAEVRALYRKNIDQYKLSAEKRLSHILLESKANADAVRAEVTVNTFARTANTRSTDPSAPGTGGDLGTLPNAGLIPEVVTAVETLKPGVISQPVQSQFGWHLLLVRDITARTKPLAEVREEIRSQELQRKQTDAVQKWRDTALKKVQDTAVYRNSRIAPASPARPTSTTDTSGTAAPPPTTSSPATTDTAPATTGTGPTTGPATP
jgi:parvulin-like peptidyl-prolyl isomerase